MAQLGLFGEQLLDGAGHDKVRPAQVSSELRTIASQLPTSWRFGTSSWSFPGWRGSVWGDNDDRSKKSARAVPPEATTEAAREAATASRGRYSEQVLAQKGLAAYAAHPLLRTVGVDRTHYAPVTAEVLAAYARCVPDDFRFLVKAHEACTLARFPTHPRYGALRGAASPHFLDPSYARDLVVAPFVDGLGDKGGTLLFQFAAQPMDQLGGSPRKFAEQLYRFLRDLPPLPSQPASASSSAETDTATAGPRYAVEVRNAKLLTADYAAALRSVGAVHCYNLLPGMPSPSAQRRIVGDQPLVVARWMLAPHHTYATARAAYGDFNAVVERDTTARREIAELLHHALARHHDALVIVNNKAEGSSPGSIFELAAQLRDQLLDQPPF
ncbi:MAG: DUF72 domain-containing protein [Kofleriaceae bacterium]|nr:DUF72 domain-containing protein [Kofleriaceae bacterium]